MELILILRLGYCRRLRRGCYDDEETPNSNSSSEPRLPPSTKGDFGLIEFERASFEGPKIFSAGKNRMRLNLWPSRHGGGGGGVGGVDDDDDDEGDGGKKLEKTTSSLENDGGLLPSVTLMVERKQQGKKCRQQHNPVMSTFSGAKNSSLSDSAGAAMAKTGTLSGKLIGINSPLSRTPKTRVPGEVEEVRSNFSDVAEAGQGGVNDRVCWQQFRKLKRSRSLLDDRHLRPVQVHKRQPSYSGSLDENMLRYET